VALALHRQEIAVPHPPPASACGWGSYPGGETGRRSGVGWGWIARPSFPSLDSRFDEGGEEWMSRSWLALELRMELHGDEPGVVGQFDDFDQLPFRMESREDHP
jgi:hypothetical protein